MEERYADSFYGSLTSEQLQVLGECMVELRRMGKTDDVWEMTRAKCSNFVPLSLRLRRLGDHLEEERLRDPNRSDVDVLGDIMTNGF